MKYFLHILLFAGVVLLFTQPLRAQWSADPTVNNPICTAANVEFPILVNDGSGGAIIAWEDFRNSSDWDIFAQRINSEGVTQWTLNGIAIAETSQSQVYPHIISDGSGGAIITWQDYRTGSYWEIFAQRVDQTGAILWGLNGKPVARGSYNHTHITTVSDGSGGVIVSWEDWRNGGTNSDVYAQRLNINGEIQWTAGADSAGFPVSSAANDQSYPNIVSDGSGGAIVVWEDHRTVFDNDIFAQRIDHNGIRQWASGGDSNGVGVSTEIHHQNNPAIISDNSGGAIIAWEDFRDSLYASNIYADRIDGSGTSLWFASGMAVCVDTFYQDFPTLTSDLSGGAIITWEDYRTDDTSDIYAQYIDGGGTPQWTNGGILVCGAQNHQQYPIVTSDALGGAIIAWQDFRSGTSRDIYAQRIDGSGLAQWTADGVPVSTATDNQEIPHSLQANPCIISDGAGNAILTWHDYRDGGSISHIYASKLFADGTLPIQMSSFTAMINTTNHVVLSWSTLSEVNNYGFEVQRKSSDGTYQSLPNSFVAGHGTTIEPQTYNYADTTATTGTWYYRITQTDLGGKVTYSSPIRVDVGVLDVKESGVPTEYALGQNYPNPFNPSTIINYQLPTDNYITLKVYNTLGEEVMTLIEGLQSAGYKTVTVGMMGLPSGVYVYRLNAGMFSQVRKMLLIR